MRVLLARDPLDIERISLRLIHVGPAEVGLVNVGLTDADLILPERITEAQPDMMIAASESVVRDIVGHICIAAQHAPRPIVLFADNDDATCIRTAFAIGVTTYVIDDIKPTRVKVVPGVAYVCPKHECELCVELDTVKTRLAERKVLEYAKGMLIKQMNLPEDNAFKCLRKMVMGRNIKLVETTQRVVGVTAD